MLKAFVCERSFLEESSDVLVWYYAYEDHEYCCLHPFTKLAKQPKSQLYCPDCEQNKPKIANKTMDGSGSKSTIKRKKLRFWSYEIMCDFTKPEGTYHT